MESQRKPAFLLLGVRSREPKPLYPLKLVRRCSQQRDAWRPRNGQAGAQIGAIHTVEYHSAVMGNKAPAPATAWMRPENMFSEGSQTGGPV